MGAQNLFSVHCCPSVHSLGPGTRVLKDWMDGWGDGGMGGGWVEGGGMGG